MGSWDESAKVMQEKSKEWSSLSWIPSWRKFDQLQIQGGDRESETKRLNKEKSIGNTMRRKEETF